METLDTLHAAGYAVHFANQGVGLLPWRREHTSPAYTTSWDDLPEAR